MAPAAGWPPFFLLLPFLLLPGPAWGNEGGAAGSCRCEKHASPPPLLARFASRLQTCDTCGDFARFSFPVIKICGLKEAPWVVDFQNVHCPKGSHGGGAGGADASRGHHLPAPTSQTRLAVQTTRSTAPVIPDESLEAPHTAEPLSDVAWEPRMARSTPYPSAGGAARAAGLSPVEVESVGPAPGPDTRAPVFSMLGLALASVGVAVLVLCRRKWQRKKAQACQALQVPPGEQEEGPLCLPGETT